MAGEEKLITLDALSMALPSWMKRSTKPSYTADDISTTGTTNQFVTANEKNTWNGKYTLPSGGIPKTDLASAVQTSLEKADSAIQTETDPTVPSWAKQQNPPASDDISDTNQTHKFATAAQLQQISTNQTNILSVEDMITDKEFDSTKSYSIGDVVTYEHKLYKFKSAHSGAWSTSDVDQITVIAYVDDHSGGGGGSGTVTAVKVGANGTTYNPDSNGVVTTAEYSTNDHSHGSLGRDGSISDNVTIATSDRLIIQDYSDSNKIKTSSISFSTSSSYSSYALTRNGTWGYFLTSHQSLSSCVKSANYAQNKSSGSLNDITAEGRVYCTSNCTNMPVTAGMFVETLLSYSGGYKAQRAEVISGSYAGHIFTRYYDGSSWSSWIDISINTPITLATSGNISSASISLSSINTGTYLFTVTNNESGTARYGCSLYVLQKYDSGTVYIMKPVSEITNTKLSSYSFSGDTMSLTFDKSGYKTLRLIRLY